MNKSNDCDPNIPLIDQLSGEIPYVAAKPDNCQNNPITEAISRPLSAILTDGNEIFEEREIADIPELSELNRKAREDTDGAYQWILAPYKKTVMAASGPINANNSSAYGKWLQGWTDGGGWTGAATIHDAFARAQTLKDSGISWYMLGKLMASEQAFGRKLATEKRDI